MHIFKIYSRNILSCIKNIKEISKSNFYFDRKGLYLKKSVLKAGWEYGIYVTYPGGSTGVYTFVYGEELISNEHSWLIYIRILPVLDKTNRC